MSRGQWLKIQAWLEKIVRETREEYDAQRTAECTEWYIPADIAPVSHDPKHCAEARVAVAMLLGEMHLKWFNGSKW
jgi:hypothetical protein